MPPSGHSHSILLIRHRAIGCLTRPPIRRVKLEQQRLFVFGQWKIMLGGGLKQPRPARRRAAAHQLGWISVVSEADRMPKLVRDHVARNVRKGQRISGPALDRNEALAVCPVRRERDEVNV
jgi:hypothetical protein